MLFPSRYILRRLMKRKKKIKMGRPCLKTGEHRVALAFSVSPATKDFFSREAKRTGKKRGIVLDELVSQRQG